VHTTDQSTNNVVLHHSKSKEKIRINAFVGIGAIYLNSNGEMNTKVTKSDNMRIPNLVILSTTIKILLTFCSSMCNVKPVLEFQFSARELTCTYKFE
jgi:hypothetical protein